MDEKPKCFVPGCNNMVGVLFPKNPELKKKWLLSLEIDDREPDPGNFVCLDHFDEEGTNGKATAIPKRYPSKMRDSETPLTAKVKKNENSPINEDVLDKSETKSDSFDEENTCRLCGASSKRLKSIYENIDEKHTVIHAMVVCLFPIKVSRRDKFSKKICTKCMNSLTAFFKFRQSCLQMDETVRKSRGVLIDILSDESSDLSVDEGNEEDYSDIDIENAQEEEEDIHLEKEEETVSKSELDKKFDKVERELLEVLEGKSINDSLDTFEENDKNASECCENIIIDVVNEDEDAKSYKLSSANLPIIIKPILPNSTRNKPGVKRKFSASSNDRKPKMIRTGKSNGEVVQLPGSIKVEVKKEYRSTTGTFLGTNKKYLFDSEFVLAEGYLYGYRLTKGRVRSLYCLIPQCPSETQQLKIANNTFTQQLTVTKPHNHKPHSASERKKLMFFDVMRKTIQTDRTLDFKSLYIKICEQDPEIRMLVPLRNVISEICKHSPNPDIPNVKSFNQLYERIENISFNRIHYTLSGPQFYQERFADDEGAKAIVFANAEIVQKYSYSKLMHVDASFQIVPSSFPYQLVTVSLWVYDSYYPVAFAIVSKQTQGLYKQIFSFLHEYLAPELNPDEIITSYESCLYYALGEIFPSSQIGGSMFYYTQNIYKRICSLNLSKDLETNANFRNIYHMLLMLPLLPVNTIKDALNNIEIQAKDMGLTGSITFLFEHVRNEWLNKVTPEFFCVHRLENRVNENVVSSFKKLRDLIVLNKNKSVVHQSSVMHLIEKLIELESFLQNTYTMPSNKMIAKDVNGSQRRLVLRAWQFIDNHPKINLNLFFTKVVGYIKCMENQLWIWGFYRYEGTMNDDLINAAHFATILDETIDQPTKATQTEAEIQLYDEIDEFEHYLVEEINEEEEQQAIREENTVDEAYELQEIQNEEQDEQQSETIIMEAVIDENGKFVLQRASTNKAVENLEQ